MPSVTIPFPSYNRFVRILDGGVVEGVQNYFVDCPELFDREELLRDALRRLSRQRRALRPALPRSHRSLEGHRRSRRLPCARLADGDDCRACCVPSISSIRSFATSLQCCTIHNAGYQGWFPPRTMEKLLLPWDMFTIDKLEHYDTVDFLKGGIVYADAITTVSRRYAEEIQTPSSATASMDVLRKRSGDLFGILNGVDYDEWNPATDPHIAAHYTAENLAGKKECRRDLLHAFGFENVSDETAVIGVVSRFATQKGFDFIVEIMDQLVEEDMVLRDARQRRGVLRTPLGRDGRRVIPKRSRCR